jgi:hypothetical protein
MPNVKIATCCYCGTRAALTLTGKTRHELACSTCGAPLHTLKMLKQSAPKEPPKPKGYGLVKPEPQKRTRPKKRPKRRKSFMAKLFEEVWDEIEDIFD